MNVRCPACETVFRVDPSKVPSAGVRARCAVCSDVFEVSPAAEGRPAPGPERQTTAARGVPSMPATPPQPVVTAPQPRLSRPVISRWSVKPPPPIPSVGATPPVAPPPPPAPAATPEALPTPPMTPATQAARPSAPVFRPMEGREVAVPRVPTPEPAAPSAPRVPGPTVETVVRPLRPAPPPPPSPITAAQPASQTAPPAAPPPHPPVVPAPRAPSAAAPTPPPARPLEEKKPINPFLARDPRQKARRLARALVSDMIVYQPDKRAQALAAGNLKEAFAEEIKKSWEEFVDQVGKEMAESAPYFTEALNEILADGQQIF